MKKILAIASASSLFLVGCGSSEPNYDAVLSKIEKTSTVPLTQEERDEWPEFADLTCMHIQQSGK